MGLYWIWSVRSSVKFVKPYSSGIVEARILRLNIHMDNALLNRGIENRANCSHSFIYLSICLSFRVKLCHSFLRSYAIFKLGILMKTDCLYRGIETQAHYHYFFIFSIFFFLFLFWMLTMNFFSGTIGARVSKNLF